MKMSDPAIAAHDSASASNPTGRRALLAVPGFSAWVAGCLLTRLPLTMVTIGFVLLGRSLGSYSLGAALASVTVAAEALGGVVMARVIDRMELRRGLQLAIGAYGTLCVLIAAAAWWRVPSVALFVMAALLGVAGSPVFAGFRSLLTAFVPVRQLPAAYAVDAVLVEVGFVLGPSTAGLASLAYGYLVGQAFAPMLSVASMGLVAWSAVAVVARLPARPAVPRKEAAAARAPWREPAAVSCYALLAVTGASIGLFEAAMAPFAAQLGYSDTLGGVLSACYALGSAIGGVALGMRLASSTRTRLVVILLCLAAGVLLMPVAVAGNLWVAGALLVLAGLPLSSLHATLSVVVREAVSPVRITEAFAVFSVAILVGISAGGAAASALLKWGGRPSSLYMVSGVPPIVAGLGATVFSLLRTRRAS